MALTTPLVRITGVEARRISNGVYNVKMVARNMGYLPTNVTEQAKKNKKAGAVKVEIILPQGAEVLGGSSKIEIGYMEGRLSMIAGSGGQNAYMRQ